MVQPRLQRLGVLTGNASSEIASPEPGHNRLRVWCAYATGVTTADVAVELGASDPDDPAAVLWSVAARLTKAGLHGQTLQVAPLGQRVRVTLSNYAGSGQVRAYLESWEER